MRLVAVNDKKNQFESILKSDSYYSLKEEILFQIKNEPFDFDMYSLALDNKNLKVRQIVANSITEIPEIFRTKYESLLNDNSYSIKEIALINLISSFPEQKVSYLNQTKNIVGFNDKSFEILWMIYAISTPNYLQNQTELLSKLSNYTSNNFEFLVRQNALVALKKLNILKPKNLKDVLECCLLPNWRNAKWSKEFLTEILKDSNIKNEYQSLLNGLPELKKNMLIRFLK